MAQVLVIPDLHLKPWVFDRADRILASGQADFAVQLGDLVDDWGQLKNVGLYNETMERAYKFHKAHPSTLWCLGNHDADYHNPYAPVSSGHSTLAEVDMKEWGKKLEKIGAGPRVIHIVDNVIFTHAGLTESWLAYLSSLYMGYDYPQDDETLIRLVNLAAPNDFFMESSPIWARPQVDEQRVPYCHRGCLQVVGHTPVVQAEEIDGLLSTDTFSTKRDGTPIGNQKFVIIDTKTKEWHYAEENN